MIKKSLDKIFETSKIKKIKNKKFKKLTKNMKLLMYINDRLNSIKNYPVVIENNNDNNVNEELKENEKIIDENVALIPKPNVDAINQYLNSKNISKVVDEFYDENNKVVPQTKKNHLKKFVKEISKTAVDVNKFNKTDVDNLILSTWINLLNNKNITNANEKKKSLNVLLAEFGLKKMKVSDLR